MAKTLIWSNARELLSEISSSVFVILPFNNSQMNEHLPRCKVVPHLNDTAGFFDYYVPYTNQSHLPHNDSLRKYYDFSIYDYISARPGVQQLLQGPSIFTGHQLSPSSQGPRLIHKQSIDWITCIIVICLIILAWIQANHSKRLRQIIRSVALPYYVNQLEREGNLYNERISLGLGFIYISSFSLFIYRFLDYSPSFFIQFASNQLIFLFIIISVIGFMMIKAFFTRLAGAIFKTNEHAHAYRLNALIFNHTTGILLFPVILLIVYFQEQPFMWIALGLISILLTYRFIRSISIGLSNTKFSVFYLILYLCTLEILPLLLLIKVIRQF